jgi:hypothetical protein
VDSLQCTHVWRVEAASFGHKFYITMWKLRIWQDCVCAQMWRGVGYGMQQTPWCTLVHSQNARHDNMRSRLILINSVYELHCNHTAYGACLGMLPGVLVVGAGGCRKANSRWDQPELQCAKLYSSHGSSALPCMVVCVGRLYVRRLAAVIVQLLCA